MISSYFGLEYFILFCDPSVTNISRYVIGSGKSALHPENDMTKSPASSNFSFCANGCCLIFTVKPGKFFSNSPFKYSPVFFDNSTSSFNSSNSISFLPSSFYQLPNISSLLSRLVLQYLHLQHGSLFIRSFNEVIRN